MFVFFAIAAAALGLTTGIAAAKLLEKGLGETTTLFGLLPAPVPSKGTLDPFPAEQSTGKLPMLKIVLFVVIASIGIIVVKWVGKKLHIKLLSH